MLISVHLYNREQIRNNIITIRLLITLDKVPFRMSLRKSTSHFMNSAASRRLWTIYSRQISMDNSPIISMAEGTSIKGKVLHCRDSSKPVYAFLGVPYASPPVGNLRFKPPSPLTLWTGQRDAQEFGPLCPQNVKSLERDYFPYPVPREMDEDCLHLNIYTPDVARSLPVIFYIYGGRFTGGFSNFYNGSAMCTYHDVVVVTINYRLGPFGYLCTGDGYIKGNMGLLDQVEALRWVHKYIRCFGGNPDNITLDGFSSGAISIGYHLASSQNQNLFRRAICESGALGSPPLWTKHQARVYLLDKVAKMGCTKTDGKDIVDFLNTKSSQEILEGYGGVGSPVLDGQYIENNQANLLQENKLHKVDMMLGFSSHDGTMFILSQIRKVQTIVEARDEITAFIRERFLRSVLNLDDVLDAIMAVYFDAADMDPLTIKQKIVEVYGHILFMAPLIQQADYFAENGCKTYLYNFTHRPSFSPNPDWVGSDHGNDVLYKWGHPFMDMLPDMWTDEEKELSLLSMRYWTNFVRTGDPNDSGSPSWPRYDDKLQQYMILNTAPSIGSRYEPEKMKLWNTTIPNISKRKENGVQSCSSKY